MLRNRSTPAVLAAVVILLTTASAASAQQTGRAVAGWDRLMPPRSVKPVSEGGAGALAARTRHYARTFYVRYENVFGGTLWRYNCHWQWRVRRHRIVRATHWEWASSLAAGWSYRGTKYLHKYGRVGTNMVGRRVQGRFTFGIPGIGTIRTKYPWIDVRVHASGSHWFSWDDG
jgi:hypothetical protein